MDHISFPVKCYAKSFPFFEKLLEPLGFTKFTFFEKESEYKCGALRNAEGFTLWISSGPSDFQEQPDVPTPDGQGLGDVPGMHFCLSASSTELVDKWHALGLSLGAKCNGPPGIRAHYHPGYYGAFLVDPFDHWRLEPSVRLNSVEPVMRMALETLIPLSPYFQRPHVAQAQRSGVQKSHLVQMSDQVRLSPKVIKEYDIDEFMLAIRDRDQFRLEALIAEGHDVNHACRPVDDDDNFTREQTDFKEIDPLDLDFEVTGRWDYPYKSMYAGLTPLCYACYTGQLGMVKALVKTGASANGRAYFKRCCLHFAVVGGNVEVVRFLLDTFPGQFDLNEEMDRKNLRWCYLALAQYHLKDSPNRKPMLSLLLERGALLNAMIYEDAVKYGLGHFYRDWFESRGDDIAGFVPSSRVSCFSQCFRL